MEIVPSARKHGISDTEMLHAYRHPIRVFDLDGLTMLVGADEQSMEKLRTAMLSMTKGWDRAKIQAIVSEALDEVIEPIVFREALDLFDEHHAAGRRVVIVSSSPVEIVRPLKKKAVGTLFHADPILLAVADII